MCVHECVEERDVAKGERGVFLCKRVCVCMCGSVYVCEDIIYIRNCSTLEHRIL